MARTIHPGPGQGEMFETAQTLAPVDPKERHGMVNILNERYLGHVALETFTETDLKLVDPHAAEEVLFTASNRPRSRYISGLAVNAAEAESVPGSVNRLTHRVAERTDAARKRRGDTNAERIAEKSHKSKYETLEGYLAKREGILTGLDQQLVDLRKIQEAVRNINLNRGSDLTVLKRLSYVNQFVFENMLQVVGDELGWDNDTRKAASQAMRYQLTQGNKFTYMQQLTNVGIRYTSAKRQIFAGKYSRAEREVEKLRASGQTSFDTI